MALRRIAVCVHVLLTRMDCADVRDITIHRRRHRVSNYGRTEAGPVTRDTPVAGDAVLHRQRSINLAEFPRVREPVTLPQVHAVTRL